MSQLDDVEKQVAERVFVKLVAMREGAYDVRRLAQRSEFSSEEWEIAVRFSKQSFRLLVVDDQFERSSSPTVEIVHEFLITQWGELCSWLERNRAFVLWVNDMKPLMKAWLDNPSNPDNFLSGDALVVAQEQQRMFGDKLSSDSIESRFISQSLVAARQSKARARRQRFVIFGSALTISAIAFAWATSDTWSPLLTRYLTFQRYAISPDEIQRAGPGKEFQDCRQTSSDCPIMVVLPTNANSPAGRAEEVIEASTPLSMSKYEITEANWAACVRFGGCSAYQGSLRTWIGDTHPAGYISWNDANDYVTWLSSVTGQHYRLPTANEWRYGAFGNTGAKANMANIECAAGGECDEWPARVGSFQENAFGLHEMINNLAEWVDDCQDSANVPYSEYAETNACLERLVFGGASMNVNFNDMKPRKEPFTSQVPYSRNRFIGFRVVR